MCALYASLKQCKKRWHLTNMSGPGSAIRTAEFMPKYPQDCGLRIAIVTAFTFLGASNIKVCSNAASERVLGCQHLASSKFAPSLDVKTLTSPGEYAQSTLTPKATRRECNVPVHVAPYNHEQATTRSQITCRNSVSHDKNKYARASQLFKH